LIPNETLEEKVERINNSYTINLVSSNDIKDINSEYTKEIMLLAKTRTNNINDLYIKDRILAVETLFSCVKTENKYCLNINELHYLKKNILDSFYNLTNSYKNLCKTSGDLVNFVGSDSEFKVLLTKNFKNTEYHNYCWRSLVTEIHAYTLFLKNIPSEVLFLPEVVISMEIVKPVSPVKPLFPEYKLTFKSLADIPSIDISGSYFRGLRFAFINFGYSALYPTFYLLDLFLGIGNPIPKELFYQSIKYFFKLKFFYGS
jgi:hypothetical protein